MEKFIKWLRRALTAHAKKKPPLAAPVAAGLPPYKVVKGIREGFPKEPAAPVEPDKASTDPAAPENQAQKSPGQA
jgi:hypothetical protein